MKRATLVLLFLLALSRPLLAAVPQTMSYQGVLKNGSAFLTGSHDLSFKLWNASSGGSLLWGPELHASVPVSSGGFSVILGSTVPLQIISGYSSRGSLIDQYWMSISVDGAADLPERTQLTASPYSLGLRLPFESTGFDGGILLNVSNLGGGSAIAGSTNSDAGVIGQANAGGIGVEAISYGGPAVSATAYNGGVAGQFNGGTKLGGASAPAIQVMKVTGTTGGPGEYIALQTGLTTDRILSVSLLVNDGTGRYVPPFDTGANDQYTYYLEINGQIYVRTDPVHYASVANRSIKALVIFE